MKQQTLSQILIEIISQRHNLNVIEGFKDEFQPLIKTKCFDAQLDCETYFICEDPELKWFKNLTLPKIVIQNIRNETRYHNRYIRFSLFCFKRQEDEFDEVQLSGVSTKEIKNGSVVFKSIKFKETTYISASQYFVLVHVAHIGEQIVQIDTTTKIRVEARKKAWQERQSNSNLFEPFLPKHLNVNWRVLVSKPQKFPKTNRKIQNLFDYITTSCVRHKIRHPIYLITQFQGLFSMYFNTNYINPSQNLVELIKDIHKIVFKCFQTNDLNSQMYMPYDQKVILVKIHQDRNILLQKNHLKKIVKYLETMNSPACQVIFIGDRLDIPQHFKEFKDSSELREAYLEAYNELCYQKFMAFPDLINQLTDNVKYLQTYNEQEKLIHNEINVNDVIQICKQNQLDYRVEKIQTIKKTQADKLIQLYRYQGPESYIYQDDQPLEKLIKIEYNPQLQY